MTRTPPPSPSKAGEYKLGFPVYKDDKGVAVEALKAEITPEVFVLDHNFVLRYRGRIDDAYTARLKKNRTVSSHDLQNALDEIACRQGGQHAADQSCRLSGGRCAHRQEGRQGDVLPRCAADPSEQLPELPSSRRGRSVLADDLQAGRQLGRGHQGLHQVAPDAAVEDHRGRRLPQRAADERQGHRHAGRLGRRRHARRAIPRTRPKPQGISWRAGCSASPTWS